MFFVIWWTHLNIHRLGTNRLGEGATIRQPVDGLAEFVDLIKSIFANTRSIGNQGNTGITQTTFR